MADILGPLERALAGAQKVIDRAKLAVKSRFGLFRPLQLVVYRSHGTKRRLVVRGRVLEDTGTRDVGTRDKGRIRNVLNTLHRFESDEIPGARLRVRACGVECEAETDHEGYFELELEPGDAVEAGLHPIEVELLDGGPTGQQGITAQGRLAVPADDCEFGVVSDLDDTVVDTGARDKLTHVRVMLARDALSHEAFPGVGEFYRQLQLGPDGRGANPIFYVSLSAWNLYDLFERALDDHELPWGAIILRDAAIIEESSDAVPHGKHKPRTIASLLELHDTLPMVLVGDSGQNDPETYLGIVRDHPDRVRAVYLRDVTPPERDREVRAIVREIEALGVPACAAETTADLARHAEWAGLVPRGAAERVAARAREARRA